MPPAEHNPPMVPRLQAQTRPFVPANTENFLNDVCRPELSLAELAKRYSTTVDALSVWLSRPDVVQRLAEIRSVSAQRAGFIAGMHLPYYANSLADSLKQAVTESQCMSHFTLSIESNTLRVRYRENIRKTVALLANIARFERSATRWAKPKDPKPDNPRPITPKPASPPSNSPRPSNSPPRSDTARATPAGNSPRHAAPASDRPPARQPALQQKSQEGSTAPTQSNSIPAGRVAHDNANPARSKRFPVPTPHRQSQRAKHKQHASGAPAPKSTRAPTRAATSARGPTSQTIPRRSRTRPQAAPPSAAHQRTPISPRQSTTASPTSPAQSLPGPAP